MSNRPPKIRLSGRLPNDGSGDVEKILQQMIQEVAYKLQLSLTFEPGSNPHITFVIKEDSKHVRSSAVIEGSVSMSQQNFQGGQHFDGCSFGDQNSLVNYFGGIDRISNIDDDTRQGLKDARKAVEIAKITDEDKADVVEQLKSFAVEIGKTKKDVSRVRRFWKRIGDVSPTVASILSSVDSISKLLS